MVALGESDKAMGPLEEGYAHADGALMSLNTDPRFDPLRANPRFQRLIHLAGYSAVDPVSIAPRTLNIGARIVAAKLHVGVLYPILMVWCLLCGNAAIA
jgi:hypothetical protein